MMPRTPADCNVPPLPNAPEARSWAVPNLSSNSMWDDRLLLETAARALRDAAGRLDAEQAVRGLDALEELEFHALLAAGLGPTWGVLREQPYPGDRTPSKRPVPAPASVDEGSDTFPITRIDGDDEALAPESDRQRCDLVLTPAPGLTVADPVRRAKLARSRRREVAGTLFEGLAASQPAAAGGADPAAIPPEDAFWLEVKLVGQYCYEAGVPGPNRTYASQLVRGSAADLAKLAKDPHIQDAGLLIILFSETPEIAEHDLVVAMHRCLDRGVAASTPLTASFHITDRIGNHACTVALIRATRG